MNEFAMEINDIEPDSHSADSGSNTATKKRVTYWIRNAKISVSFHVLEPGLRCRLHIY